MSEKEQMKLIAETMINPVYVLTWEGVIYEVWKDFEIAFERYSSDEKLSMKVTELKGSDNS